jgi:hypothetical protein
VKRLCLAALAGSAVLGVAVAPEKEKAAADVPPPYVPGWVRPADLPPDAAPEEPAAPRGGSS